MIKTFNQKKKEKRNKTLKMEMLINLEELQAKDIPKKKKKKKKSTLVHPCLSMHFLWFFFPVVCCNRLIVN